MAPKPKESNGKQKTLMNYFTKGDVKPKVKPAFKARQSDDAPVEEARPPRTPESKRLTLHGLQSSGMASSASSMPDTSSIHDTPPTSDPVDIDMDDEEEVHLRVKKSGKSKRKVVADDSDEESAEMSKANSKRPRLSAPLSEDDDDEELEAQPSFSKRLSRFKKSPQKRRTKSVASSDDDDFTLPSEPEEDEPGPDMSSASSSAGDFTEDDDDDEPAPKKKAKSKTKLAAPALTASGSGSGAGFLTAAERREQDKKNDKKASEGPYSFLQDIQDKDRKRPGDKDYDPRTIYIPKNAWKEFTPFERQFWEIKQNHYDTVLFFQKGKFYELYEDDARIGHQEFDLKITARVKMSMVGVPEQSFDFWTAKFLGKGYKVGRVDQSETALGAEMRIAADKKGKAKSSEDKAKDKIVQRELNKVYTNGTLVDPEMLTDEQAGHCVSIIEEHDGGDQSTFGICVLDCSTSQFNMSHFADDVCHTKLETMMRQLRPKEILVKKTGSGSLSVTSSRLLKSILPSQCTWTNLRDVEGFSYVSTIEELKKLYPDEDDAMDDGGLPETVPQSIRDMAHSQQAVEALGSMIWYLRQLNIGKDILSMKNFNVYDPMKRGEGLVLDGQTLAHLEILMNDEGTEEGTLLKLLSRCITPFGKRLFRIWLCMPLREISTINDRLDAVEDILDHPSFESQFSEVAKGLPDLERIVARIHAKSCKIKDFLKVLNSFKKLSRGMNALADTSAEFESKTISGLLRGAPDVVPNIKHIEEMFERPSSEKDAEELVPQEGKDDVYDEVIAEIKQLEKSLNKQLKKMEATVGGKLAYWHSATGNKDIYLVETSASLKNVPREWTKHGGTKAKTRYIVPSLQAEIRKLKEARENRKTAIATFKSRLYAEFDLDRPLWLKAVRVFAELDCLFSLAKSSAAIGEPSCRPEFVDSDTSFLDFQELRHPTLSLQKVEEFIPNDIKLGNGVGKVALLTGPNMAGKSTCMRMTATGVIMAQLGMRVPAASARLTPVDSILTRMGAYDNMFSNASTFKVELDECCKILRDATPRSLVILDELGRGTSTYDGMAIAGAVLHELATHTLPLTFFATHYGSLTDDFAYHPSIRNMHMSTLVDDEKKEIVFLFKLVEGVATSSFGTHVANLAGVPIEVVNRADTVSKSFAQQFQQRLQDKKSEDVASRLSHYAQADFVYLYKLATGQAELPDDPERRREVLKRLKAVARSYVKQKE
ncbi:muts domain V-domain-containing protein [Schizophyllum amplum]|uniref:DNA mismatch repair protein n=1 Tax=Schizophyllum amplum TaxID=97359 RepID=A0A550CBR6_9AGAR|nr:muts domain V-domain-containing protein [Auriculariopsis ampla]